MPTQIKYLDYDGLVYYHSKVKTALGNKVDKVSGKGLSTNDFTNTLKNKLDGIANGAQVNVIEGVNVNGAAVTPTNKIVNLTVPTKLTDLTNDGNFVKDANYVHTDNNFTTALKNKLDGIAAGAEVNVQSDWNIVDTASDAFIKNKPSIPTKTSDLTNDSGFITNTNYATASTGGVIKVGSGLDITDGVLSATGGGVADEVDWENVINKPTNVSYWTNDAGYITSAAIPTKTSDLDNDSGFITSGDVPTKTSDLTNDSGFITNSTSNLTNYYKKSQTYSQEEVNSLLSAIVIPTKTSDLTNDGSDGTSTYVESDDLSTQLANKQDTLTAGDHINITDSTIKAVDYVHSDTPVPTSQVTSVVTNDMIADGTITADKLASGATVKLTLSTSDIGEGAALAANTLYGVYQ